MVLSCIRDLPSVGRDRKRPFYLSWFLVFSLFSLWLQVCVLRRSTYLFNSMNIVLIGMNHKTASLELREKLPLFCGDNASFLEEMRKIPQVEEAMYLSTCN